MISLGNVIQMAGGDTEFVVTIGTVMANFIEKYGFVVADFSNPIESGYIQPVIEIKKEDFRVISGSVADQKLVKEFKDLFRNK